VKLGLFGGSFDPVHLGHLLVAQAAMEELGLERFYFIPAAQSPFKRESKPAPATERLRLLRLALAGKTNCVVDEQEVKRGGVSYTVDTLRDYARRFPQAELFYLIGADNVTTLPKWREAAELSRLAEFVAIPRPGVTVRSSGFSRLEPPEGGTPNAGTADGCEFPPPFRGRTLKGWPLAVSSSQIRERIKAGLTVEHLVAPAVAEAIRNYRLYL
jgi:nicotinate-nucleotide adenylyltransferase